MLLIQQSAGYGLAPLMPMVFVVLVSGFLAVQIKAARIHTSVELTPTTLRQGQEIIKIADIVAVPGDPLADIKRMESTVFVMKNGAVYKQAGDAAQR